MGKFARTLQMMGGSWQMLQQDKRLILFPLISGLAMVVVMALFAAPIYVTLHANPLAAAAAVQPTPRMYLGLFVFYFLAYSVILFFNAALVACVLKQIDGDQPTLGYGLACAWQRLPQIIGWALLTSSIGIVLRMLEQRIGLVGRIVVGMLGMAWSVTAFLVVPVMVVEGTGPIESYKRSVAMLRRSWGEQIIGNAGFGLIFSVLMLVPASMLMLFGMNGGATTLAVVFTVLVVYAVALGLVQSTLQTIYQVAIYCYAVNGEAPPGFDNQLVAEAFTQK